MAEWNFEEAFARAFEAAGCHTQLDMANVLGIRQSSVSDAKRRKAIPADWLIILLRRRGINPEWILTGNKPRLLQSTSYCAKQGQSVECHGREPLECFSAQDLADELVRRVMFGGK